MNDLYAGTPGNHRRQLSALMVAVQGNHRNLPLHCCSDFITHTQTGVCYLCNHQIRTEQPCKIPVVNICVRKLLLPRYRQTVISDMFCQNLSIFSDLLNDLLI